MHHNRPRLGVAVIMLALASVDGSSMSEVLPQLERPCCPSVSFIFSIKECLILEPTTQASERFVPGEWLIEIGELGLLKASSCNMSPILDSMLKAKLPRTLEYASNMECPMSYKSCYKEINTNSVVH